MTDPEAWTRVGDAAAWLRGRGRRVDVRGTKVAVFFDGTRWIAVDDACPHMGASLADGRLMGGELRCSWHAWRYDTATGRCPLRSWARVRVHDVRLDGGGVYVRLAPDAPASDEPPGDAEPDWLSWEPERYFRPKE